MYFSHDIFGCIHPLAIPCEFSKLSKGKNVKCRMLIKLAALQNRSDVHFHCKLSTNHNNNYLSL